MNTYIISPADNQVSMWPLNKGPFTSFVFLKQQLLVDRQKINQPLFWFWVTFQAQKWFVVVASQK